MVTGFLGEFLSVSGLAICFRANFYRYVDRLSVHCEARSHAYETYLDASYRNGTFRLDDRDLDVFFSLDRLIDALFRIFDRCFLYELEYSGYFAHKS